MNIDEIKKELNQEIDLCSQYIMEEDIHKNNNNHERLALHIITMCMQTLLALRDNELEELKSIKEIDLDIPQHFTKEQSDWIKKYCILKNIEFYNNAIDDVLLKIEEYKEKHFNDRNKYPINYGTLLDMENWFNKLRK